MRLQFCRDCNSVKQEPTGTAVLSTVREWILKQLRRFYLPVAPDNHVLVNIEACSRVFCACAVL